MKRAPNERAATPRGRLADALARVKPSGPVLDALPPSLRGKLVELVARLAPERRAELIRADGAIAAERPLLHLTAGGDAPSALLALAATSVGSDELYELQVGIDEARLAELPGVVAEVARRAAASWLRDRSPDVLRADVPLADLSEAIERAAATLARRDLQCLARETAEDADGGPARALAVVECAAAELDVERAVAALARARGGAERGALEPELGRAERSVELARDAKRALTEPALDVDRAVTAARALVELGRSADALRLLEPHRATAATHLGLAAALALASLDGGTCPGLAGAPASWPVCAAAWDSSPLASSSLALLARAWSSKRGRDAPAIETWLGYSHVVPFSYASARRSGSREQRAQEFRAQLKALIDASKEASAASPRFAGVALFADSVAAGFDAHQAGAPDARPAPPGALREDLQRRARELAERSPLERFTQAGVLGVAALFTDESDAMNLVAPLAKAELPPELALTRALLTLWSAVAYDRADEAELARSELALALPGVPELLSRSRLVLTLAEADVALTGSERALTVLEQVAGQLLAPQVPAELRLRAALDVAGALGRAGRVEEAEATLERVASTPLTPDDTISPDLLFVVKGYLLVLRGRASRGGARAEYRGKLAQLARDDGGKVPASLRWWRDAWVIELERLSRAERCGGGACAGVPAPVDVARMDAAVGAATGLILRRGALGSGTLQFQYEFRGIRGLHPVVAIYPRLLAVEFPPTRRGGERAHAPTTGAADPSAPAAGERRVTRAR